MNLCAQAKKWILVRLSCDSILYNKCGAFDHGESRISNTKNITVDLDIESLLNKIKYNKTQDIGDFVSYKRSCVSLSAFQKLRRGIYRDMCVLDLHGLNCKKAAFSIVSLVQDAAKNVILLIHGKSLIHLEQQVTLKDMSYYLLRKIPRVLAFCSAKNKHGGSGAMYVLLKK